MKNYKINTSYAKALLLLAEERGVADRVADDMRLIEQTMRDNRQLAVLFGNPTLPYARKERVVEALFGERVCEESRLLIRFVVKRNRSVNLGGIAEAYLPLYRESRGIVLAELRTYQPASDEAQQQVAQKVSAYTGKQVELRSITDPRVLGGFKLEFDHNMYDARLRTKLRKLRIAFAKNEYEKKI